MLNSHPNSSGPSLGNSANRSCAIEFQNCQSLSVIQNSSVVVSLAPTQRSWVQVLVPVKTLFSLKIEFKSEERYMALFPKLGPSLKWREFFIFFHVAVDKILGLCAEEVY